MSSTVRRLIGIGIALTIGIPLVVLMFITPAAKGNPHDLPIGVVGSEQVVDRVGAVLDDRQPGGFDVTGFATAADLRRAITDRDVYGGFVVGSQPQTLIATGASPSVATMLTQIGDGVAASSGATPTTVDIAPPTDGDPRGTGFASMLMPVFLAGAAIGAVSALVGRRRRVVAAALPVGAAAVAASTIGVATWVGVLSGTVVLEWLALALGILAIAAPIAGLVRVFGPPGIGIAALVFMLVGMPLAGVSAPREFLPWLWGDLGQLLPLGAAGTASRSAAFFDGAGSAVAYVVLVVWATLGFVLLALHRRAPGPRLSEAPSDVRSDASEPETDLEATTMRPLLVDGE